VHSLEEIWFFIQEPVIPDVNFRAVAVQFSPLIVALAVIGATAPLTTLDFSLLLSSASILVWTLIPVLHIKEKAVTRSKRDLREVPLEEMESVKVLKKNGFTIIRNSGDEIELVRRGLLTEKRITMEKEENKIYSRKGMKNISKSWITKQSENRYAERTVSVKRQPLAAVLNYLILNKGADYHPEDVEELERKIDVTLLKPEEGAV
jgi:hypothetical protein